jgi:hypothetical protein
MSALQQSSTRLVALRAIAGACLAVASFGVASATQSDSRIWQRAYEDGRDAIRRADWVQAERSMRRAIEVDPAPSPSNRNGQVLFSGTRRTDFFPEYFLAVAVMNQDGREQEALNQFRQLRQNGLLPTDASEYGTLATFITQLESKLAPPPPPPGPPSVDPARQTPPPDPIAVNPSGGIRTNSDVDLRAPSRENAPPVTPAPANTAAEEAALVRQIEGEITSGRFSTARSSVEALRRLAPGNRQIGALTRRVANGVSALAARERSAIRLFFTGDYGQASGILEELLTEPDGKTARAYFYSACSQAALGLLEGPDGSDRLEGARSLLSQIGNTGDVDTDRTFISPAILQALSGGG